MLSVARTDLMRVVILVPDLDVAFVDRGDPVTIQIEALKGQVFRGTVARFANSENTQKLMRTEVDLPNPGNRLRDGMYGMATLELEPPSKNLTIPSTGLIEQTGQGKGSVYVIQDGKVVRQPVQVGEDNGREVEILSGLTSESQVVVSYSGSIAVGLAVHTEPAKGEKIATSGALGVRGPGNRRSGPPGLPPFEDRLCLLPSRFAPRPLPLTISFRASSNPVALIADSSRRERVRSPPCAVSHRRPGFPGSP